MNIVTEDISMEEFFKPVVNEEVTLDMWADQLCRQAQLMELCMDESNIPNRMAFSMCNKLDGKQRIVISVMRGDGLEEYQMVSELQKMVREEKQRAEKAEAERDQLQRIVNAEVDIGVRLERDELKAEVERLQSFLTHVHDGGWEGRYEDWRAQQKEDS